MRKAVLFMVMVMSIGLFALSCQSSGSQEVNEEYQFYYYPQKNVYFDVEKKSFYYSLNGGKSWDSLASTSDQEPLTLGDKIIVYSADNRVYKDNAAHRKLYNGRLINIADADTSFVSAMPEVAARKLPKRKTAQDTLEENEPIKGLTKFLYKIFGKHNKKKEEQ
jgi:deoxyxylulose-5-phosphate synthase